MGPSLLLDLRSETDLDIAGEQDLAEIEHL